MQHAAALALIVSVAAAAASFSPLSPFYDNYVSTRATFFSGRSFGSGCARGGAVPDGFIAVAMNGLAIGLGEPVQACGLCLHIKGPPATTANPKDNQGVTGEYYAFVYDVCADCTQQQGLQLGVPGDAAAAQQTDVVWRAIPCPPAANALARPALLFEGSSAAKARFQVRGLSSPIMAASVSGRALLMDGAFFVYLGGYPFVVEVETGLGEVVAIEVPAYRANGILSDLIKVDVKRAARQTTGPVPIANQSDPLSGTFGNGHITTVSGPQTRTVITTNQNNRQIISILTSPNDQAVQAQQVLSSQRGFANQDAPMVDHLFPTRSSAYDSTPAPRSDVSSGPGGMYPDIINEPVERSILEAYLTSKSSTPSALTNSTTPSPISATTPAPTNATTPAPTNATTPVPTNATTPAPTNATTSAPTNATTLAPTSLSTNETIPMPTPSVEPVANDTIPEPSAAASDAEEEGDESTEDAAPTDGDNVLA